jgi:hypothetical protein
MSSPHTDPTHRHTEKWLEKSLVAPSPSLIYERSDGEKAASEELIHEKAKTEWWSREITRALFAFKLALVICPLSLITGMGIGLALCER